MITNKDVRVENGNIVINGDKYPLGGQSPEAIMQIVEDNSDTTPTENSDAPITSGGVYTALGTKRPLSVNSAVIGSGVDVSGYDSLTNMFITPHEGFVRFLAPTNGITALVVNDFRIMTSNGAFDYKGMWLPKGVSIYFMDGVPSLAQWFNCSDE